MAGRLLDRRPHGSAVIFVAVLASVVTLPKERHHVGALPFSCCASQPVHKSALEPHSRPALGPQHASYLRADDGRCATRRLGAHGGRDARRHAASQAAGGTPSVTSPLPVVVASLLKNIIGATVLSLAAGVAAFSDLPGAVIPASVATVVAAALCAYTFALTARSCELAGAATFREAWARTVGQRSACLVSAANTVMAGAGCLQYLMVLADAGSSLAAVAGTPPWLAQRSVVLLAIAGGLLLPLSFLENCSQLQYTSVVGICGVFYYILAMLLRCVQGAYAPGGHFHLLTAPALRPAFAAAGGTFWSAKSLVLLSTLTTAYVCHYNAPKFYRELEDRSMPRLAVLVSLGFGIAAAVYVVGLCSSFLTFGGASAGFIFNNYAANDGLFVVARAIVSMVILCTYPLLFVAFRDGALELMPNRLQAFARRRGRLVTLGLVALLAGLGLVITDVGVIVSVPGAIFGSAIVYVCPALCFLRATQPAHGQGPAPARLRVERAASRLLVLLGAGFATFGAGTSLGLLRL